MFCKRIMAMSTRKSPRPKAGSTAIPFMITVLISLVLFGSVALYFYNLLTQKHRELQPMQSATTSISEADINTILFVLEPDDQTLNTAIMILHFDPIRKQEFCMGIPLDLVVDHEGRTMTVSACLANHGASALKTALSKALDQEIVRYIELNSRSFKQLVDMIGNVSYIIPIKDEGLRKSSTSVLLDSDQFLRLLTSTRYENEMMRYSTIGMSVAALLNSCEGERIGKNIDTYFSQIINNVSTDITMLDFQNHRHALKYVFEHAHDSEHAPARGIDLVCDQTEDNLLTPNAEFLEYLKITFYQVITE